MSTEICSLGSTVKDSIYMIMRRGLSGIGG